MRSFPSASRQRLAAAATVAAMALGATAIPNAWARDGDNLGERRNQVQSQIKKTQGDLQEASKQAARASRKLAQAQTRLEQAQGRLSVARDQLAAARTRDVEMQQALEAAEARLVTARAELAAGRIALARQREQVAESVVTLYEQGDPKLRALSALVNADSLADLELRSEAERTMVTNESSLYADLELARDRLASQKVAVAAARAETERKREAAAAHLAEMRSLETRAAVAAAGVREQVGSSRSARQAAVRARQQDRAALQRLKQREQRIRRLIAAAAARNNRSFNGSTGGLLGYPVKGPVTSPYGYRTHPIYGYYGLHNGTDFGAGCGQPLFASARGTVITTYYDEVYGNRLFLGIGKVNGANITLVYNHMSGCQGRQGRPGRPRRRRRVRRPDRLVHRLPPALHGAAQRFAGQPRAVPLSPCL